jgi:hypothetical protein
MTLRRAVIALGIALLALAAALAETGARKGGVVVLLTDGVVLAGGVIFERYRYKPVLDQPPGPGWIATAERSVEADHVITVWFNPQTGERSYVRTPPG